MLKLTGESEAGTPLDDQMAFKIPPDMKQQLLPDEVLTPTLTLTLTLTLTRTLALTRTLTLTLTRTLTRTLALALSLTLTPTLTLALALTLALTPPKACDHGALHAALNGGEDKPWSCSEALSLDPSRKKQWVQCGYDTHGNPHPYPTRTPTPTLTLP